MQLLYAWIKIISNREKSNIFEKKKVEPCIRCLFGLSLFHYASLKFNVIFNLLLSYLCTNKLYIWKVVREFMSFFLPFFSCSSSLVVLHSCALCLLYNMNICTLSKPSDFCKNVLVLNSPLYYYFNALFEMNNTWIKLKGGKKNT